MAILRLIFAAMKAVPDKHHRAGLHNGDEAKQCGGASEAPPVPKCCKSRPVVDKGGTKKGSGTRVRVRKKMKSYAPVKKKKGGKKKSV